jgi:carbon storage regulator
VLVLRRRAGESILIGADVEITVVETGLHRVVLGITAPGEVRVLRKEIRLAEEENRRAAVSAQDVMKLAGRLSASL